MTDTQGYLEKYDVFLSYRRDGGETMAILLRDRLTAKGYRVFLDVESLNSGSFNEKLLQVIENCTDFIVVLSPGCLQRCENEGDWVRIEIAHALKYRKNIVPVMLRGFQWPQSLPVDIVSLASQNGVNASSNEFFDAAIERLMGKFLQSKPGKKGKAPTWLKWAIPIAAVLAAAAVLLVVLLPNGNRAAQDADGSLDLTYRPSATSPEGSTENPPASPPVSSPGNSPGSSPESPAPSQNPAPIYDFFENLPLSGNMSGNILNNGLAAGNAERIFFTDNAFNIYQFDTAAQTITLLHRETGSVTNLNYYKGLLYYTTDVAICSIDPDSGARTELSSARAETMYIEDDTIYYLNRLQFLKLYSLSLDGRTNKELNDLTNIRYRVVTGGHFYFSDNSEGTKLFRTDLDGGNRVELTDQETHWANVLGDNIIYSDLGPNPKLVRMNTDGGDVVVISQMPVSCLNISNAGYLYANGIERSFMFMTSFDGGTETRMTDFPVRNINVVSDWIFFCSRDENDAIYVMRTDGSQLLPVADFIGLYPRP